MIALVTPALAQVSLYTTDLIADGRDTALDVGDLTVAADGTITFQIDEASTDWRLEETHLYVGDEAPAKSAPGQFTYPTPTGETGYGHEELGGVASDSHSVDLAAADVDGDGIVYIAAHAELIKQIVDPDTGELIYVDETAWAQGDGDEPIGKGKNWATCFSVSASVVEPPAEEPPVEQPPAEESPAEQPEEPQQPEEAQVPEEAEVEEAEVEVTVATP